MRLRVVPLVGQDFQAKALLLSLPGFRRLSLPERRGLRQPADSAGLPGFFHLDGDPAAVGRPGADSGGVGSQNGSSQERQTLYASERKACSVNKCEFKRTWID